MPNIYALSYEAETLYNRLISAMDEDTGEVDIELANALAEKQEEFAVSATNYASVIRALKAKQSEAEAEIARIKAISDKLGKVIERMTNGLSEACQRLNIEKLDGLHAQTTRSTTTTTTTTTTKKEDELKFESVKYIVNRYDSHILAIKEEVREAVKGLCEKANVKFDEFEKAITEKFSNEIKF